MATTPAPTTDGFEWGPDNHGPVEDAPTTNGTGDDGFVWGVPTDTSRDGAGSSEASGTGFVWCSAGSDGQTDRGASRDTDHVGGSTEPSPSTAVGPSAGRSPATGPAPSRSGTVRRLLGVLLLLLGLVAAVLFGRRE